jgi:hypothetical protein
MLFKSRRLSTEEQTNNLKSIRNRRSVSPTQEKPKLFDSQSLVILGFHFFFSFNKGTGFSGKSTFLKNLHLMEESFDEKMKKITRESIFTNICYTYIELLENVETIEFEREETNQLAKKFLKMMTPDFFIDIEYNYDFKIHSLVCNIWKDEIIRSMFYNSVNMLIPDGSPL